MPNPRIAVLAADFTRSVVDVMVEEATREAAGGVVRTVRVSGSYEVPLLADTLLADGGIDLLVVLGYIERGETLHGEVMGNVVHRALVELQLKHRKPVGIGIIGPGATLEQAETRKADYARSAVRSAVRSWHTLRELDRVGPS